MTTDNIINLNRNVNNEYYYNNLVNIFNNIINQIIINHPVSVPIVDGYVFCGFDKNPPLVNGKFSNDMDFVYQETGIPRCKPVVIGRAVFPKWALDVCVIGGRRI
mgnify:CR=1 FL=1